MNHLHIAPFFLVAGLLVMAACDGRTHRTPTGESMTPPVVEQQPAPAMVPLEPAVPGTVVPVATTMEKQKPRNTTPSSARDGADNLRGWDPALEDDTHDNGMRRYMENNDDEGWD